MDTQYALLLEIFSWRDETVCVLSTSREKENYKRNQLDCVRRETVISDIVKADEMGDCHLRHCQG